MIIIVDLAMDNSLNNSQDDICAKNALVICGSKQQASCAHASTKTRLSGGEADSFRSGR
jgi:hypothetical protein